MKFLVALIILSLANISFSQEEEESDATWEETIEWINSKIHGEGDWRTENQKFSYWVKPSGLIKFRIPCGADGGFCEADVWIENVSYFSTDMGRYGGTGVVVKLESGKKIPKHGWTEMCIYLRTGNQAERLKTAFEHLKFLSDEKDKEEQSEEKF